MKTISKYLLCFLFIFSIIFVASCSKNKTKAPETTPVPNEEYYAMLGYHTITFDTHTKILYEGEDKVVLENNKIMLPNNSTISLEYDLENNSNITLNHNNYFDFINGKVLVGFKSNDTSISLTDTTFKVKENLNISADFIDFDIIGIANYQIRPDFDLSIDISGRYTNLENMLKDTVYFYTTNSSVENFQDSKLISNGTEDVYTTTISENKFKLNVELEIFMETTDITIYLIIKDANNGYYLFEAQSSVKEFTDDCASNK